MRHRGVRGARYVVGPTSCSGLTLVELLVALSVLGIAAAIGGLGVASLRVPQDATVSELRRARTEAIRTGRPVARRGVLFLPDGRALGSGVDPVTGVALGQPR